MRLTPLILCESTSRFQTWTSIRSKLTDIAGSANPVSSRAGRRPKVVAGPACRRRMMAIGDDQHIVCGQIGGGAAHTL